MSIFVPVRPEENAREEAALREIIARGIVVRDEPDEPRENDCTFCTYHAYDANDVNLDGGRATALLGWIKGGYIAPAYLRPVRRSEGHTTCYASRDARHA